MVGKRDDSAMDMAAVVLGARVDCERPSDLHDSSRFMDVPMQRE